MENKHVLAAFATDDLEKVNAEFVKAKHILVYDVSPDSAKLEKRLDFAGGESGGMQSPRVTGLAGCAMLFVPKPISGDEALGLIRSKVFIVKLQEQTKIDELLAGLQDTLKRNPPLWMRKAMSPGSEPELTVSF